MADFYQTGGMPNGYSDILNSARQQLVRMPDGTFQQKPQFGGPTSLDQIYGGILPTPIVPTPLKSRSVSTVPIDQYGNPTGFSAPTMAGSRAEQSGVRSAYTQGVQPAGTTPMPFGARPASVNRAFAMMGLGGPSGGANRGRPTPPATQTAQVWDPFGTSSREKDLSRLGASDPRLAFAGDQPAALGAIDSATGVPLPRRRPGVAPIPITPSPLLRGGAPASMPSLASLGNYTVQRGDTVWDLARKNHTTVSAIAMASGLADPSKIRAGQRLVIPVVPAPRQRPAAISQPSSREDRFTNLDSFGRII